MTLQLADLKSSVRGFYWLKLVLLLLISLCANKKGGSIKVVSLRFDVTTDEMSLLYLEQ